LPRRAPGGVPRRVDESRFMGLMRDGLLSTNEAHWAR
jgi:hypothetical protein